MAIAEEIEHQEWLSIAHSTLSLVYLDLLDSVAAHQHCEIAYAHARASGARHLIGIAAALLASAHLLNRDTARATDALDEFGLSDAPIESLTQGLVLAACADVCLVRGQADVALRMADRLIAWTDQTDSTEVVPRLWMIRGEALADLRRIDEAEAVLRVAADSARDQGARSLLWRILVTLGKVLQTQGRRDQAELAYRSSREIIEDLAASVGDEASREKFRERALAQLPQIRPVSPRRAEKQQYGGLTTREREVAALIARGYSNREIAGALVVSERTVEAHTGSIRDKLGVASRTQVVAWAIEHILDGNPP
jgi:DNA-binding NarL/FixJ family response regulator